MSEDRSGNVAMGVLSDVMKERLRQIKEKGFTPEHDDQHPAGQLGDAADCYLGHAVLQLSGVERPDNGIVPFGWPWGDEWWKPSPDPRRNLVKAGALILAEIERMDREASRG